jgi:hypothetical protein
MNGRDVCGVHDLTLNEKWSLPQKPQARNLSLNGVLPVFAFLKDCEAAVMCTMMGRFKKLPK